MNDLDVELGEKTSLLNKNKEVQIYYYENRPSYDFIKENISEWYLMLNLENGKMMFIDEEALSKKKPVNKKASEIAKIIVAGDVIISN